MKNTLIIRIANKLGILPKAGIIDQSVVNKSPRPFQKADHIVLLFMTTKLDYSL